jgi:WXG100 family type VII secretion target
MSGGDYTRWSAGSMSQGVADMRMAYRATEDELNDLESALEGKLQEWEGGAREAYWVAKREWEEATRDLNAVLEQLGAGVENVHQNYDQAERDGVGIFEG